MGPDTDPRAGSGRLRRLRRPVEDGVTQIGKMEIPPATRKRIELPIARLTTGSWVHLPVQVVSGARRGPRIFLSGAIHGDEVLGIEIVRRVIDRLDPERLTGAVIAVPTVNVYGLIGESRYLPDRRDLNRSFPGSARGSMAAQLAHLFMEEVVKRCSCGIDYHCGSDFRFNLPQTRADLDDPETAALAQAFAAPLTLHSRPPSGSLRESASEAGVPVIVYEAGEAGRFDEPSIEAGVEGTARVLAALGMVRSGSSAPPASGVVARRSRWLRAPRSGILRLRVGVGERVSAGQSVAFVADAFGEGARQIRASLDGLVISIKTNPMVHRGEAVLHVAPDAPATPD